MIKYMIDKENKYKDELLVHLRAHNKRFTGEKAKEIKYIYLYKDNLLVGSVMTTLSWDWAGYKQIYYKNVDVLQVLISESVKLFHSRTLGYKAYATNPDRIKDIMDVGFEKVGSVPGTKRTGDVYYLELVKEDYPIEHGYTVEVLDEEKEEHKEFISNQIKQYRIMNNLNIVQEEIHYVALEDKTFCGGIYLQIFQDMMYIDLLAVKKEYKGKGIGTKLMQFAEDYARDLDLEMIDVGTTEFQARPFYERMGYRVVNTKQNYPKGYECYALNKLLKE